ncbi:MAG: SUMF1/EgtB/PvdO family nonheme iron enzyme [Planctomycetota bacterium]|nr:SUMF1/EgtB/PvdO family nonheme iron enzyme [Planctomycetota bacterium]
MKTQIRVCLSGWPPLILSLAALSFAAAAELPPHIMVRQYFIEMDGATRNKNYGEAIELAEKALALKNQTDITPTFYIRYAETLLLAGRIEKASEVIVAVLNNPDIASDDIDAGLRVKIKIDDAIKRQKTGRGELRPFAELPSDLEVDLSNGVAIKFKKIPAGFFLMGSPASEEGRREDEVQHEVTISKPFYLGIYEVTQEQYQAVMGNNPSKSADAGGAKPVDTVSWENAREFCRKASDLTGKRFRLPTEAEWEYACRAGTATPFSVGKTIGANQANYNGEKTYGSGEKGVYRRGPIAAGSFPSNAWGLYDMHGNVWEWCSDWYGAYATGKQTDPQGTSNGEDRILRGGCWGNDPRSCRSARRGRIEPAYRFYNIGFRVALD